MRFKSTLIVVLLIVVASATPLSVTGQEQPLPTVVPRIASIDYPNIALIVEPFHATPRTTLADAARANDFPTFDALYREASRRGESLGAYATLHELWSASINDPLGAFYGPELYQRLARAYPGYARFIEDYRIIDDRGNAFYPASETRTFLLARAVEGVQTAPKVLIAETRGPRVDANTRSVRSGTPASSPAGPAASRRRVSTQPAVSHKAPARVAARDAARPAGEDASAPTANRTTAPAVAAPVQTTTPAVTTPEPVPAPAPIVAEAQPPAAPVEVAPAPVQPIAPPQDNLGNRGILLLVIGLIGIGLLAVMLRTPKEAQPQTIIKPADAAAAQQATAEPLRRPTPAPGPKPVDDSNRATGSHG